MKGITRPGSKCLELNSNSPACQNEDLFALSLDLDRREECILTFGHHKQVRLTQFMNYAALVEDYIRGCQISAEALIVADRCEFS